MLIKMRRSKGFTLVELLLVVAILAVLAFLAIPAIAETIRNSRMRTCVSNERMVEEGIWRWYADQIAAGRVLGVAEGAEDQTLAEINAIIEDSDDLTRYFTPGGIPNCPFHNAQTYAVSFSVDAGGLLDILCVCAGSEGGAGGLGAVTFSPRIPALPPRVR